MKSLEEYFSDVEKAAADLKKTSVALATSARQLHRIARSGERGDLKRSLQRTHSSVEAVHAAADSNKGRVAVGREAGVRRWQLLMII